MFVVFALVLPTDAFVDIFAGTTVKLIPVFAVALVGAVVVATGAGSNAAAYGGNVYAFIHVYALLPVAFVTGVTSAFVGTNAVDASGVGVTKIGSNGAFINVCALFAFAGEAFEALACI